jgi:hypothetical protein
MGDFAMSQVLSSVLYLTDGGGPTLVLEQSAGGALAPQGFLSTPRCNTLLCFTGHCLHGVLPGGHPIGLMTCQNPPWYILLMHDRLSK